MGRYYEADDDAKNLMEDLLEERFEEFRHAGIKVIMDGKLKIDKLNNRIILAYIKTTNDIEKYLTTKHPLRTYGYDYFIFINELVWELAGAENKKRIMSHELRHMTIDAQGNYKIRKHEIEDFYAEVELNEDDPKWSSKLSSVVLIRYEQLKEEAKNK